MKFFTHNKGLGLFLGGLGLLFGAMLLIILASPVEFEETIGVKQYTLLTTNEEIEAAEFYLSQSLPFATSRAEDNLFASSGIPSTSFGSGRSFQAPCGTHLYTLYNNPESSCLPHFQTAFTSYTQQNLKQYLDSYQASVLMSALFVDVISTPQRNTVVLAQAPPYGFPLSSKLSFVNQEVVYPRGILGGYASEEFIRCGSGTCVAQVAEYLTQLYIRAGLRLPYVEGGESPYSYEDSLEDKEENEQSIFLDVPLTQTQEGRRSLTQAGFDGSGWLWWIGKHASVPELLSRRTLDDLYARLSDVGLVLCQQKTQIECSASFMSTSLEPGDIIFVEDLEKPVHVMIYLGDNQVSHSQPGIGLTSGDIPTTYLSAEESHILAVIRVDYLQDGRDIFLEEESKDLSCSVPVDFTQVNTDSFRTTGILQGTESTLRDFEQKIVDSNQAETITLAASNFAELPEEFIKAMIYKESGPDKFAYLTGSRIQSPGNPFYGPMQMGTDACEEMAKKYDADSIYYCDWDVLREGGYESARMSILSGTAYLDWLIGASKYLDPQNLDYYFLAIAYNAGPGSLNKIMEEASRRTGIEEVQLQWRDIVYQDVARGLHNTGQTWARDPLKWDEVWEYPNFVNYVLGNYCEGDIYATYRSGQSFMYFQPQLQTSSTLDLVGMSRIEEFVKDTLTCQNNLDTCVEEKHLSFTQEYETEGVTIHLRGEEESAAYEVLDKILDCHKNQQTNCICDVSLQGYTIEQIVSTPTGQSDTVSQPNVGQPIGTLLDQVNAEKISVRTTIPQVALSFDSSGGISLGSVQNNEFIAEDDNFASYFFPLHNREGESSEEPLVLELDHNLGASRLFRDSSHWIEGDDFERLALVKLDSGEYFWMKYSEEYEHLTCRDNKHFYRFQSGFDFTSETIDFSLYLNDTVAPSTVNVQAEQLTSDPSAVLFSWNADDQDIFAFNLSITPTQINSEASSYFIRREPSTSITSQDDISTYETLYVMDTSGRLTYYYLVGGVQSTGENTEELFEIGSTYSYSVSAYDHYLNQQTTLAPQQISIVDIQSAGDSILSTLTGFSSSFLTNLFAEDFATPEPRIPFASLALRFQGEFETVSRSGNQQCTYCGINKERFNLPDTDYCVQSNCPAGSALVDTTYHNQCEFSVPNECPSDSENCCWNPCRNACGPTSVKMVLDSIQPTSVDITDIQCSGGSLFSKTKDGRSFNHLTAQSVLEASGYTVDVQSYTPDTLAQFFSEVEQHINQGQQVIFSQKNKGGTCGTGFGLPNVDPERCYCAGGHVMTIVGYSENFLIVNDPFTSRQTDFCSLESGNNLVISKDNIAQSIASRGSTYTLVIQT